MLNVLKIGDFSKMTQVSVGALRHYDRLGLLRPVHVCPQTGYRFYVADQLSRLRWITAFKEIGFSLDEIAVILERNLSLDQMLELLETKRAEVLTLAEAAMTRAARIEEFASGLQAEMAVMPSEVVIREIPPMRVASIRAVLPTYADQLMLWEELEAGLRAQGLPITTPSFTVYYDEGYSDSDVDLEVAQTAPVGGADSGRIKFGLSPGLSAAACVIHKGPFEKMRFPYYVLAAWLDEKGYEMAGPGREYYIFGAWNQPDPEQWVTEIQVPVRKASNAVGRRPYAKCSLRRRTK